MTHLRLGASRILKSANADAVKGQGGNRHQLWEFQHQVLQQRLSTVTDSIKLHEQHSSETLLEGWYLPALSDAPLRWPPAAHVTHSVS